MGRPENRGCTAQLLGVLGVPTNTQARLSSTTIIQMFINQDEAKLVGGWSILTYNGPSPAFIWVTDISWEMQVGTICPTKNLRPECGRGEGLRAVGSTVTRQALWCVVLHVDLLRLPNHARLSQKVTSLSSCLKRKNLHLLDFLLME